MIYNCNNNYLSLVSNSVIVATSPKLHLEMIENLVKQNKNIIVEKPIVTSQKELYHLQQIITKKKYYNALHFSFGSEIEYFIKHINLRPNKIYAYISDNYVSQKKIKKALHACETPLIIFRSRSVVHQKADTLQQRFLLIRLFFRLFCLL